jgi:hypothetical protein
LNGAHNALLDLEEMEDCDLEKLRKDYEALATLARDELRQNGGHPSHDPFSEQYPCPSRADSR